MADINTIYSPAIDYTDPDVVIATLPGTFPWSPRKPIYLPDPVRQSLRDMNAQAVATANGVKVPFSGNTQAARTTWVTERINAVDARLQFVKQRTFQLLEVLKQGNNDAYNTLLKSFSAAISAVPVVGSIVGSIVGSNQAAQALDQYKLQSLIKDYQTDAEQLVKIRQALGSEFVGTSPAGGGGLEGLLDPTYKAPGIPTYYYYIGGFAILIIILLIVKNRRRA